jgi:leucine dehydrogenase
MQIFEMMTETGHEQLVMCSDRSCGYRGIIAIHDTTLGPALGGTRFWNYNSETDAILDALRLARAMTFKNAVAGLSLGGGKAVIIGDNHTTRREMLFRAHGRFIESLGGRYVTAEDVGTTANDMEFVHVETDYVSGLPTRSGDPSPVTARGVFRAIQASARMRWGSESVSGRTVAVQGLGHVGHYLCRELHAAGAGLIVTDIDARKVSDVVDECGAQPVAPDEIYAAAADIFAPCALGGILNDETIPRLKVEIIAGGANNQLLEERHGEVIEERGILYAPDFVANAGGVINVYGEIAGWSPQRALRKADEIFQTTLGVFEIARDQGVPTYRAAERLAERRLAAARSLVRTKPQWPRKL